MSHLHIPNGGWVLVCDGRKALFLRNKGDNRLLDLRTERSLEASPNDRTSDQGSARPGRIQNRAGPTSAVETTDWHALAEQAFAEETCRTLEALSHEHNIRHVVVVAPARALANLRQSWSEAVHDLIRAEIPKDLTKHPISEIERILTSD
jgi:protein required for attachment to host cells